MPEKVFDNVYKVETEAVYYDGTAEGLTQVCQMVGVIPALGRIEPDGVTMIYVHEDTLMLHPNQYVVAAKTARTRREKDYSGDVYSPDEFKRRFVVREEN